MRRHIFSSIVNGHALQFCLLPIFYYSNTQCEIQHLVVWADGVIELSGSRYDLGQVRALLAEGNVGTSIPDGEWVYIPGLVAFGVSDVLPLVEQDELVKELEDVLLELNNQPTSSDVCLASYNLYVAHPTESNRAALKTTYEKVPKHLRCWLLGFPEKDAPIRAVIYGNECPETTEDDTEDDGDF